MHFVRAQKIRYFSEMRSYTGPMHVPNKRQKKPPGAPKRAMSAFLSFSQLMRPKVRAQNPQMKNTDISGVLAQLWREGTEEEKLPHIERELRDREKYHEDMSRWKQEELVAQHAQHCTNEREVSVQSGVDAELFTPSEFQDIIDLCKSSLNSSSRNDLQALWVQSGCADYYEGLIYQQGPPSSRSIPPPPFPLFKCNSSFTLSYADAQRINKLLEGDSDNEGEVMKGGSQHPANLCMHSEIQPPQPSFGRFQYIGENLNDEKLNAEFHTHNAQVAGHPQARHVSNPLPWQPHVNHSAPNDIRENESDMTPSMSLSLLSKDGSHFSDQINVAKRSEIEV